MLTKTSPLERIMGMLNELETSAYQCGWDEALEHVKSLALQSLHPPAKKERLRKLSLYPLTLEQALKGAMETGPPLKSGKAA